MSNNDDQDRNWLGHNDLGTSPIVIIAMSITKVTLYSLACLVVLILGVFLWQKSNDGFVMAKGDWGMVSVLAVLALFCALLARKISTHLMSLR